MIHASEFGIKDYFKNKFDYAYAFTVTMGSKTELDEVKSANARKINKQENVISDYDAARQLGNDLDSIYESNTRAKTKQIEELMKTLDNLAEMNKKANPMGMNFKLDENSNIVQDMDYIIGGTDENTN